MLEVLGAGLSRTGSFSLKRALETLGLNPCYHMDEVFRRADHVPLWAAAMSSSNPDWHALLDGYASAVDAPVCHFWKSIRGTFPSAKVILTMRDAESWYDSFRDTVYQSMIRPVLLPAPARPALAMARQLVGSKKAGGPCARSWTSRFRIRSSRTPMRARNSDLDWGYDRPRGAHVRSARTSMQLLTMAPRIRNPACPST